MSVPQPEKDIPVFSRQVIEAMSVSGKGIAKILEDAKWIKIVDEPNEVKT